MRTSFSIWRAVLALHTLVAFTAADTGELGDAIPNTDDPSGAAFIAELPPAGNIKGRIIAVSAGEQGTQFSVLFSGLPVGGPYGAYLYCLPSFCITHTVQDTISMSCPSLLTATALAPSPTWILSSAANSRPAKTTPPKPVKSATSLANTAPSPASLRALSAPGSYHAALSAMLPPA